MQFSDRNMARQSSNVVLLLIFMQMIMFGLLHAVEEWEIILEEENMEMENQLRIINKTPIKSFKTDYGDILDCIDINKQHAFDNPLLKDHKVQMAPKNIPNSMTEGEYPRFLPKYMECPQGTVMIKRSTKEDLIMVKKMKDLGLNFPTSTRFRTNPFPGSPGKGYAAAVVKYSKHNFGARTISNVWKPIVSYDQASWSNLWIANGPENKQNVIQAGWGVHPKLFSSNYTRLLTFWTIDGYRKTACSNYLCPGFIQVHASITLGLVLNQISVYKGTQRDIEIAILFVDGAWWLKLYNQFIGYWPQKLFYYLYGGANYVVWGGQAYSPSNQPSPQMGSGHFPSDGHQGLSAYFKDTQIWDNVNLVYPEADKLADVRSRSDCYGSEVVGGGAPGAWDLYYGGPGRCNI